MAIVETIGKSIANQAALMTQIYTDLDAAGWTKHDYEDHGGVCAAADVSIANDTFTIVGHGLSDGDLVQIWSDNTVPAPFTNWNPYFVTDMSGNTFTLAAIQGGTHTNISSQGVGNHYIREYMRVYYSQGESGTLLKSYIQFVRAGATSVYTYGCYGFNAVTHAGISLSSAQSYTTSESGMIYYFWGNKDFVVIAIKSGSAWITQAFGWPVDYYTAQTTITQAETSGTPKQIHVADNTIFKVGKYYQIYSLVDEGRDFLLVNSVDAGSHITVASLPRNYASGSLIGQVTNSFGRIMAQGNSMTWIATNPSVAVGVVATSATFNPPQPITAGNIDPDQRGDQKYLITPILVGESDGFVGWIDSSIFNFIPATSIVAEDTLGVTESDSGTASSGTATTIVDSSKTWTPDAYIGKCVIIKTGNGAGQIRKITDNDATSLTVAAWVTEPILASTYVIVDEAYRAFPSSPPAYSVREGR